MALQLKKTVLVSLAILLISHSGLAQKERYDIKIMQDSILLPDSNQVILLEKRLFKIQVELQSLEGVYLFAAFKDSIYTLDDQQPIPDFKNLPSMSMAEENFNPDQELIISDDGWAYWFFDPKEDWHRFDKEIRVSGKQVIAVKSVKQFYLLSTEKTLPISEVAEPLYLFFISAKKNKTQELTAELQRYKVKINWK